MVAKRVSNDGHKLRVRWKGPRRISRVVSEYVYEVEDLVDQTHAVVHANRLKFYADSHLDVTEELLDTIDHNEPHYNTVEKLMDLRFNEASEKFEVQVKWKGFDHEKPTWEPFENIQEDVPDLSTRFLDKFPNRTLVRMALGS